MGRLKRAAFRRPYLPHEGDVAAAAVLVAAGGDESVAGQHVRDSPPTLRGGQLDVNLANVLPLQRPLAAGNDVLADAGHVNLDVVGTGHPVVFDQLVDRQHERRLPARVRLILAEKAEGLPGRKLRDLELRNRPRATESGEQALHAAVEPVGLAVG